MVHGKKIIELVSVIFLFIGVAIAPNITNNVTKASEENNLVEITTHIYDTTTETTVTAQLTERQTQEVRTVFDDLKNRLSTAESTEETQRIFNDTIIELDRYNLLPEGMSVEQAQHLINRATSHQNRIIPLQRIAQNHQEQTTEGTIQNTFCHIAGNTTNTHFTKLAKRTALRLYYIIDFNTGNAPLVKVATALFVVFNDIGKINQLLLRQNGYHLGVCIYFGNYHYAPYPDWLSPAQGWLSTDGVNGKQNITGSFWGQTMTGGWQPQVDWYMNYTWRGCLGFTGLILYTDTDTAYYLGSALAVNVGPNRP
ncbi:MAG: hypothetical protein NTY91_08305 [Euryarchaeota archaeon]|nr:hypothetical protein [Euryarchaeota archaeon]